LDDLDEWLEAMHKEMSLFENHKVWILVKRENQKVLPSRWVLGVKDTFEEKIKEG
jgi:DNA recombination-dependent growth factor C